MFTNILLNTEDKFCYLGDMLDAGGGTESSTATRERSGWEKFRGLLPLLTTNAISLKVKGELYAACIRSVMLYGSETWPIKVEESQRLHRNEMAMIRWMCDVTMRDRYPCEELRAWVGIKPSVDVMRQRRLHWFGHIERREDNSWLKKVQILAVDGHSGCGRPRKTWEHVIMESWTRGCPESCRVEICHYMNSLTHACME